MEEAYLKQIEDITYERDEWRRQAEEYKEALKECKYYINQVL